MMPEKPTLQPSKKWDKRRMKEISNALQSDLFDFFNDEENELGSKDEHGSWYIRFKLEDGPYAGQTHIMKLKWIYGTPANTYEFPQSPPMVNFITPIWHTNISSSGGSVCLDTIKENWTSAAGLEFVFNSIIALLTEPGVNSPFNIEACKDWKEHGESDPASYAKICSRYYKKHIRSSKASELLDSKKFTCAKKVKKDK